jgi:hypothetical protein
MTEKGDESSCQRKAVFASLFMWHRRTACQKEAQPRLHGDSLNEKMKHSWYLQASIVTHNVSSVSDTVSVPRLVKAHCASDHVPCNIPQRDHNWNMYKDAQRSSILMAVSRF